MRAPSAAHSSLAGLKPLSCESAPRAKVHRCSASRGPGGSHRVGWERLSDEQRNAVAERFLIQSAASPGQRKIVDSACNGLYTQTDPRTGEVLVLWNWSAVTPDLWRAIGQQMAIACAQVPIIAAELLGGRYAHLKMPCDAFDVPTELLARSITTVELEPSDRAASGEAGRVRTLPRCDDRVTLVLRITRAHAGDLFLSSHRKVTAWIRESEGADVVRSCGIYAPDGTRMNVPVIDEKGRSTNWEDLLADPGAPVADRKEEISFASAGQASRDRVYTASAKEPTVVRFDTAGAPPSRVLINAQALVVAYPGPGNEVVQCHVANGRHEQAPPDYVRRVWVAIPGPRGGAPLRLTHAPIVNPTSLEKDSPDAFAGRQALIEWFDTERAVASTHCYEAQFEELVRAIRWEDRAGAVHDAFERSGLMSRGAYHHCVTGEWCEGDARSLMERIAHDLQGIDAETARRNGYPANHQKAASLLKAAAAHFDKAFPARDRVPAKPIYRFHRVLCPGLRFPLGRGYCTIRSVGTEHGWIALDYPARPRPKEPVFPAGSAWKVPLDQLRKMIPLPKGPRDPGGLTCAVDRWVHLARQCRQPDGSIHLDGLFPGCGDAAVADGLYALSPLIIAALLADCRTVRIPAALSYELNQADQAAPKFLAKLTEAMPQNAPLVIEVTLPKGYVVLSDWSVPAGSQLRILNPEVRCEVTVPPEMTVEYLDDGQAINVSYHHSPFEEAVPIVRGSSAAAPAIPDGHDWAQRVRLAAYRAEFENCLTRGMKPMGPSAIATVVPITADFALLPQPHYLEILRKHQIKGVGRIVFDPALSLEQWTALIPMIRKCLPIGLPASSDLNTGHADVYLPAPRGLVDLRPLGRRRIFIDPWPAHEHPQYFAAPGAMVRIGPTQPA